jgi:ribonuclease P protein component
VSATPARPRLTFPRRLRLTRDREYRAAYTARVKRVVGPLTVHARPNGLEHYRLGLSVGRSAAGSAVARNRIKRLIREAFRTVQHDLPRLRADGGEEGYDLVVGVRRHELLELAEYRDLLVRAVESAHGEWSRRRGGRDGSS